MGTKACKLCYMHTTTVDGGLICEMHHRQELHALRSDVARLTAERDALKAEVEAMRGVVDSLRLSGAPNGDGFGHYHDAMEAIRALDALRTRA